MPSALPVPVILPGSGSTADRIIAGSAPITTATGIAAAIPAVIGYNHFVGQIKRVAVDMDCFSQDFLNIVQRGVTSAASRKVST